eukprot:scaffold263621_cov17-Prasinocladus_malaysianus.AAC.1
MAREDSTIYSMYGKAPWAVVLKLTRHMRMGHAKCYGLIRPMMARNSVRKRPGRESRADIWDSYYIIDYGEMQYAPRRCGGNVCRCDI